MSWCHGWLPATAKLAEDSRSEGRRVAEVVCLVLVGVARPPAAASSAPFGSPLLGCCRILAQSVASVLTDLQRYLRLW